MEVTAKNIDRLVTIGGQTNGIAPNEWIFVPLYEAACNKLNSEPVSLVAAQRMIKEIKPGDRVLLLTGFASFPRMIYGETDGPLGVASLARAVSFGLGALPVLVAGSGDMEALRPTVKAAGLNVLDYSQAKEAGTASAAELIFPCVDKEESKKFAASIMNECDPKAIISVEAPGPNKKGVKHTGGGKFGEESGKFPGLEYLFYEAHRRKLLSIGCIDRGNELGSGTIEEGVRRIVPYGNICQCPCGAGIACAVKADIVFPAGTSNWAAYAITAMIAYLLENKEILQDVNTEHRMLEACIMAGAIDGGTSFRLIMAVDGVGYEANEGVISILHGIVENVLIEKTYHFA